MGKEEAEEQLTSKLYQRFSELSGISAQALRPVRIRARSLQNAAIYSPEIHAHYNYPSEEERRKLEPHELRHGLQFLANERVRRRFTPIYPEYLVFHLFDKRLWKQVFSRHTERIGLLKDFIKSIRFTKQYTALRRKWSEPTNFTPSQGNASKSLEQMGLTKWYGIYPALVGSIIAAAKKSPALAITIFGAYSLWFAPQYFAQVLRNANVKSVYRKHGEDGLVLMWALPPKKLDALKLRRWRKEMVTEGLLHPQGGLTAQGEDRVKKAFADAKIREFLLEAARRRQ